jgi:proline dehydrogenase
VDQVAAAADHAGTTVAIDMEDSSTVDSALAVLRVLRARHPGTGAVLRSYLHRTPDAARALAGPGARIRLSYRYPYLG